MARGSRGTRTAASAVVLSLVLLSPATDAHASSALDLVRIAQTHELKREEELALRRYTEAISLDATCEEAYLGLGSLRARRGDLREAERVYSTALERMPQDRKVRLARAYVRRALGANAEAADDLLMGMADDVQGLRTLARWYGEDGLSPAQLAVWRRIAARAETARDARLLREARTMVHALGIVVDIADPARSPPDDHDRTGVRRTVKVLLRRRP